MKNLKDKLTNVIAIVLLVAGALDAYLKTVGDSEINWFNLIFAVGGAVVAYFTGKAADGKAKKI